MNWQGVNVLEVFHGNKGEGEDIVRKCRTHRLGHRVERVKKTKGPLRLGHRGTSGGGQTRGQPKCFLKATRPSTLESRGEHNDGWEGCCCSG